MKPGWLDKKIRLRDCRELKAMLRAMRLETVCEQASCPNIAECFSRSQATFLIMGRQCTRLCSFCNIVKGALVPPDEDEPARVAEAAGRLGLKHVVVTSVTRDDLPDGGARFFAATVLGLRRNLPEASVEILIPDFNLSQEAIRTVVDSKPDIIAHNVETVPSLYAAARSGAEYARSLKVLRIVKSLAGDIKTKSGLMLGLGERRDEVLSVIRDLRRAGCDYLSVGQYLAPSNKHYPVKEYIHPDEFSGYKKEAIAIGFAHVESAPYVRSSYMAGDYIEEGVCISRTGI